MEEAPENGKVSSHSAHADGIQNKQMHVQIIIHEDIRKPRIFICHSGTSYWGKRMEANS